MQTHSRWTSPLQGTLILLVAATITTIVCLSVLEVIFGSWFRNNPWDQALALNIVVDRKITFDASMLYEGGGSVEYTRDRWGLRGNYGDTRNISILTVGGSTTDQRYIPDGATWQDTLERKLSENGRSVHVANAGVDGHSSFAHLASYDYWFPLIPGLRPKYVILFVGLNDMFLTSPRQLFEGSADGATTLKSRIKANSAVYRLYAMARGLFAAHKLGVDHQRTDFGAVHWTQTPRLADHGELAKQSAEGFGERMKRLLAKVRESGATPICVTQPSQYYRVFPDGTVRGTASEVTLPFIEHVPINGVDIYELRKAQDAVMVTACAATNAPLVDMNAAKWEESDFYDFVHMTPHGTEKFGQRLAIAMKNLPQL